MLSGVSTTKGVESLSLNQEVSEHLIRKLSYHAEAAQAWPSAKPMGMTTEEEEVVVVKATATISVVSLFSGHAVQQISTDDGGEGCQSSSSRSSGSCGG
jgi:butyrate kinase